MNIKEFQNKLGEILALAKNQDKQIAMDEIIGFFQEESLSQEQLQKVAEYLMSQGMTVKGYKETKDTSKQTPHESVPLTAEETDYLRKYEESMAGARKLKGIIIEETIEKAIAGDAAAREGLIGLYMPKVVEIAKYHNHGAVFLGDLIAEGNLHLLIAVNALEKVEDAEGIVLKTVEAGIINYVEDQTNQKQQDEMMVDKVTRLESAIKELTDDDERLEFSVDELAIFLDMSRGEIEDILRLAGEVEQQKE